MSFKVPSDNEEIQKLNEKIDEISDNQIFSNSSGAFSLSNDTFGRRNSAYGRDDGLRGYTPRVQQITENDVDQDGNPIPTGVCNRINLVATLAIIDDLNGNNPMSLKYINSKPVIGTSLIVTPRTGKTLTIEIGGDFDIPSQITVNGQEFLQFIFLGEDETGISGGGFRQLK